MELIMNCPKTAAKIGFIGHINKKCYPFEKDSTLKQQILLLPVAKCNAQGKWIELGALVFFEHCAKGIIGIEVDHAPAYPHGGIIFYWIERSEVPYFFFIP